MLVDNIAEAIWAEYAKLESQPADALLKDAEPDVQERIRRYAEAALGAVAVPTPQMLSQGNRALQAWDDSEHYRSPINGIYHAMISAELPPKPDSRREDEFDEL